MPQTRIGISGWTYAPWRGIFYPKGVTQKRELSYASRMLNSIELNGSFYSLQRPTSYETWYAATPDNFIFSVKGPRFITHIRRLRDVEAPLANFFASGVLALEEKLGPIFWQFPPSLVFEADKFNAFFDLLPRDTESAAKLAHNHETWMKGRTHIRSEVNRPLRYAIEIRHASFENSQFIDMLHRHEIAIVFADTAGKWPYSEDVTTDFIYARLHGDEELYASGYTPAALDRWAARIEAWRAGKEPPDARHWSTKKPTKAKQRDVFVYFDNDVKVKSPFDAMSLADRLGKDARGVDRDGKVEPPAEIAKAMSERVRSHWPAEPRARKTK